MSVAAASRRCAAMRLPFAMIFAPATCSAEPPTAIEREPNVPVPTGTVTLAVVMRTEVRGDAAVRCHAHLRRFVKTHTRPHHAGEARRCNARRFDVAGDADAASTWAFLRVARDFECTLEDFREVAAVVS